jgi:hypothetical protein
MQMATSYSRLYQLKILILRPAEKGAELPLFNLPYYEGLNRYDNRYWLGIYQRDELFSVRFFERGMPGMFRNTIMSTLLHRMENNYDKRH